MTARWPLNARRLAVPGPHPSDEQPGRATHRRLIGRKTFVTEGGNGVHGDDEANVLAEIRSLRDRVRHVAGSLVASVDGRLVAHDTHGVEPDSLAALSAAVLGLSQRLIESVGPGQFAETVTRGSRGYVATYAAGPRAVLTVLCGEETNVGRLHLEARQVANRLATLFDAVPAALEHR